MDSCTLQALRYTIKKQNVIYSASKKTAWGFLTFFPKRLGIFSPNFTRLLQVPICVRLQIFIQLSPTLTKLCRIKCDHPACVLADGGHFELLANNILSRPPYCNSLVNSWTDAVTLIGWIAVQALVMIQKIRDAFNELLEEVPWMDEETRIVAREKVSDAAFISAIVLLPRI